MKNTEELSDKELASINGGSIFGQGGTFLVGSALDAWSKMHKHNKGMASSAING